MRPWTSPYLIWVAQLRFTQVAQEATRQDYLHQVEYMRERVACLEQAIMEGVKLASPALQQVINDLQALRGIADISAVTIAAELGQVAHLSSARQLMAYCGAVPSEDSSGKRTRRGDITKTGNAHLRRIVVEAAWSYRRPPCVWYGLRRRQESISEETKKIAWKARHRLHKRYMKLGAAGKDHRKTVTAVARELLGFIWAIGTKAKGSSGSKSLDKNQKQKQKHPKKEKDRDIPSMKNVTYLEHRASSSQSKHEGEFSLGLCDRLDRTRANSQRQLPTDHDYAVPTREYQTDQSSPSLPWLLLALSSGEQQQPQKQPHRWPRLTRSLHIKRRAH